MATRKRRTKRRTTKRKAPRRTTVVVKSNPSRRRRRHNPRRRARRSNPGVRSFVAARRTHRRRRSNPSIGSHDLKKLGIAAAIAAVGGFAGVAATTLLEGRVSQPPRTLGILKLALGAAGVWAGAKVGQPLAGIAFAGAVGASAAKDLVDSFGAGAGAPAAAGQPALPPGAAGAADAQAQAQAAADMQAVMDDDDMDGAEGMAAVFDGDDGSEAFSDDNDDFETGDFDREFLE